MTGNLPGIDRAALTAMVESIEALEADKAKIAEEIRELYAAAKESGLDPKLVRALVRERRQTEAERNEFAALLDAYRAALGDLADTPLGQAAAPRAG